MDPTFAAVEVEADTPLGTTVVLLGCLLFAGIGLAGLIVNLRRLASWPATTGTVVGYTDANRRVPLIAYRTRYGVEMKSSDKIVVAWARFPMGKEVTVRYDAADPAQVMIGLRAPIIFGGLFLWAALWGVIMLSF